MWVECAQPSRHWRCLPRSYIRPYNCCRPQTNHSSDFVAWLCDATHGSGKAFCSYCCHQSASGRKALSRIWYNCVGFCREQLHAIPWWYATRWRHQRYKRVCSNWSCPPNCGCRSGDGHRWAPEYSCEPGSRSIFQVWGPCYCMLHGLAGVCIMVQTRAPHAPYTVPLGRQVKRSPLTYGYCLLTDTLARNGRLRPGKLPMKRSLEVSRCEFMTKAAGMGLRSCLTSLTQLCLMMWCAVWSVYAVSVRRFKTLRTRLQLSPTAKTGNRNVKRPGSGQPNVYSTWQYANAAMSISSEKMKFFFPGHTSPARSALPSWLAQYSAAIQQQKWHRNARMTLSRSPSWRSEWPLYGIVMASLTNWRAMLSF